MPQKSREVSRSLAGCNMSRLSSKLSTFFSATPRAASALASVAKSNVKVKRRAPCEGPGARHRTSFEEEVGPFYTERYKKSKAPFSPPGLPGEGMRKAIKIAVWSFFLYSPGRYSPSGGGTGLARGATTPGPGEVSFA